MALSGNGLALDSISYGKALIDIDSQRLRIAMIRKGITQPCKVWQGFA